MCAKHTFATLPPLIVRSVMIEGRREGRTSGPKDKNGGRNEGEEGRGRKGGAKGEKGDGRGGGRAVS